MLKTVRVVFMDRELKTVTISSKEQVVGVVGRNDGVLVVLESEPFDGKESK